LNDQLLHCTTSAAAAAGSPAAGELRPQRALAIGAHEMTPKDHLLLRSLIRLLDGRDGRPLHFVEDVADCNVLFVGAGSALRWHAAFTIRVAADGAPADGAPRVAGLSIAPPLRLTNVLGVLRLAGQLVDNQQATDEGGLLALFNQLSRLLLTRERRITALPLRGGGQLTVDIPDERLHSTLSLQDLLAGAYAIEPSRRAEAHERALLDAGRQLRVRDLLWHAARRLGERRVPAPPLRGTYRMLRWPEAVALACPGVPRLAALMTSRAMDVDRAGLESGIDQAAVTWLLHAGLALGVVAPAEAQAAASPAGAGAAAQSLITRLRERLKLW
jgi:hypothetical protein